VLNLATIFDRDDYVRSYPKGSVLFAEGEVGKEMYVVLEGEVEIVLDGKTLEKVARGGLVGELALIDDNPRSATAVAATDCRVAAIDERQFTYLVQQTPSFSLTVMAAMAERLRRRTHS